MLSQDMEEAKSNKCTMEKFEDEIVFCFLQYLNSVRVEDKNTVNLVRSVLGPESHIFKRTNFENKKFTINNYYQVEDLMLDYTEYLKEHIADENVIGIWMEAEKFSNSVLGERALEYLVERRKSKTLEDVPGFTKAFAPHDKPLKDLVGKLSSNISKIEANALETKINELGNLKLTVIRVLDWSKKQNSEWGGGWGQNSLPAHS